MSVWMWWNGVPDTKSTGTLITIKCLMKIKENNRCSWLIPQMFLSCFLRCSSGLKGSLKEQTNEWSVLERLPHGISFTSASQSSSQGLSIWPPWTSLHIRLIVVWSVARSPTVCDSSFLHSSFASSPSLSVVKNSVSSRVLHRVNYSGFVKKSWKLF